MSGAMKLIAIACASGSRVSEKKNRNAIAATTTPRTRWMRSVADAGQRPPVARHSGAAIANPIGARNSSAL